MALQAESVLLKACGKGYLIKDCLSAVTTNGEHSWHWQLTSSFMQVILLLHN